ncbi:MAG: NmrA family NAD(P)-binding protein [bacterium]|nr:NmrA family NAD(P)-binding protein [bacterium]
MSGLILVTGATGNVGREVVRELTGTELVRAADFDVARARQMLGDQVECVEFDFLKTETFGPAFTGVERLFLMRPPAISNVQRDIAPAVEAAKAAGVKHVVFLSIQGVENNRFVPHYKIEKLVEASGMAYTFLRCGFFMQNLSTTHRDEIRVRGEIAVPVGKTRTAFIDVRDIGAVAAKVLTMPYDENRVYTLTGSEALDYQQVAKTLTSVLGKTVRYTNPSPLRFIQQQLAEGRKFNMALVMTMLYTITRFGNAAEVSDDVPNLLHRAPISFQQFAQDNRAAWAG